MSEQTVRVVLDITFDNELNEHPLNWDWAALIDCAPDEVKVSE